MQAITYQHYGSAEQLSLTEVDKPKPKPDQALIRIHAVSINGADKENLVGRPLYARLGGPFKPRSDLQILGSDIAGVVEAVGSEHREFKPGDNVYGELTDYRGGFAEYVCTQGKTLAHMPDELSFAQAAALPQAGTLGYFGIVETGKLKPGQQVLINGAGGSAGTFALQMAKLQGAEVTGVDNSTKAQHMRQLGADHTLDYTQVDFTRQQQRYDLILDFVADKSVWDYQRALRPGGAYYMVGGSVATMLQLLVLGPLIGRFSGKSTRMLVVPQSRKYLQAITGYVLNQQIKLPLELCSGLESVPEAMAQAVSDQARGKWVICVTGREQKKELLDEQLQAS